MKTPISPRENDQATGLHMTTVTVILTTLGIFLILVMMTVIMIMVQRQSR